MRVMGKHMNGSWLSDILVEVIHIIFGFLECVMKLSQALTDVTQAPCEESLNATLPGESLTRYPDGFLQYRIEWTSVKNCSVQWTIHGSFYHTHAVKRNDFLLYAHCLHPMSDSALVATSLSNRRENVPLIVVVVGDRTWSYEQNQSTVMFKTVCDLSVITRRREVLHGRTTNRVWSHHNSFVVTPPDCVSSSRTISSSTSHKLFRLAARPNGDASHDLHLQSLATIGGTCNKRAILWRRWKVWPIVVNRPTSWRSMTNHTTNRDHLINVNNILLFMNKWMTLFSEQHTHIKCSH